MTELFNLLISELHCHAITTTKILAIQQINSRIWSMIDDYK